MTVPSLDYSDKKRLKKKSENEAEQQRSVSDYDGEPEVTNDKDDAR
jgi:hypothetical protein